MIFVAVGCAREVQLGLAAMRPKSQAELGPQITAMLPVLGNHPEGYEKKADVWGLNPDGELVSWTSSKAAKA